MKRVSKKSSDAQRRQMKRLFLWTAIMALVCAFIGIAVLVRFFAPRDRDSCVFEVPSFIGAEEDKIEVSRKIDIRREWVYSREAERGIVISQTPYAHARRKLRGGERCDVTIYISLGEKTEKIPDLYGTDYLSAAAALRSIGARVRSVSIYSDGEDGIVIGTSPEASQSIREGETVTLFVVRKKVDEPICVPDFCGMEASRAAELALSLGMFVLNDDFCGRVSEQSIPAGARVRQGSYISFKTEEIRDRQWPPVVE